MKDYLKTTLAVIILLSSIKFLHGLVVKHINKQCELLGKIEEWDI